MRALFFDAEPYVREEVTRALEAGADGIIAPPENAAAAQSLARCRLIDSAKLTRLTLSSREDEHKAAGLLTGGLTVLLRRGWEIIPVENLLAAMQGAAKPGELILEVAAPEEAKVASGILERGVDAVAVPPQALSALRDIAAALRDEDGQMSLTTALITEIAPAGMGHRVCVDTLSRFVKGQGMLVGNSAAFTFLVNAETEFNEYVAPRPFRVNAGAVHAYALLPGDATAYLDELRAGARVLIVDAQGRAETAVAGRIKVERRPMLLIRAKAGDKEGAVFLQNAETIRLVTPEGEAKSVVKLAPGDKILCRLDAAGRHFGLRIKEAISES